MSDGKLWHLRIVITMVSGRIDPMWKMSEVLISWHVPLSSVADKRNNHEIKRTLQFAFFNHFSLRVNVWELLHFSGTLFPAPHFSDLIHWFITKITRFSQENANSAVLTTEIGRERRYAKNNQKVAKKSQKSQKTVLMCSYGKNSGKFCPKQVLGHFGAKSTNQNHFF